MTLDEQCSFRAGWLTRHVGNPCKAKAWEDLNVFKAGYAARKAHDVVGDDAFMLMVTDEREYFKQEVSRAAA